jgi:hypothetical protein
MDARTFADGMRAWVALTSGIHVDDVCWRDEPLGMQGRPCAELSMLRNSSGGSTDEVRLLAQGAGKDALVHMVGNRVLSLSILVRTRDQTPDGAARVYCERMRDALYWPSTQATFETLGVGLIEVSALVDMGRVFDRRRESGAALDLKLSAALDVMPSGESLGTIERVSMGGAANGGTITIPDRVIP